MLEKSCNINHKQGMSVTPLSLTVLAAIKTDCTVFQPFIQSRYRFLSLLLEFLFQYLPTAVSCD